MASLPAESTLHSVVLHPESEFHSQQLPSLSITFLVSSTAGLTAQASVPVFTPQPLPEKHETYPKAPTPQIHTKKSPPVVH